MSSIEERAAALRERVDEDYPQAWDYKELPKLVGVVESIDRVETDYGPRAVAAIREIEGAKQRYSVWLSVTALRNRFKELDIQPGELVAIRYLGQGESTKPGFQGPHRFRVDVDRSQGGSGFDWGAVSDDPIGSRTTNNDERYIPDDSDIPF